MVSLYWFEVHWKEFGMKSFIKGFAPLIGVFLIAACGGTANSQDADASGGAISGEYQTDPEHRYITFNYVHQGYSKPYLRWRDWDATLDWNAADPAASSVVVTIDANSIDSGVDRFDGHLRSDDFFDVENHPEITFKSTDLNVTGDDTGTMTGDLTVKGITKPVTLDVKLNRSAFEERAGAYKIGFSATGVVKRSDFDVDAYTPFVSDDVNLNIEAEFVMPVEQE